MPALVNHPTAQGASLEEREIGSNQGRLRRMVRYSWGVGDRFTRDGDLAEGQVRS